MIAHVPGRARLLPMVWHAFLRLWHHSLKRAHGTDFLAALQVGVWGEGVI